MKIDSFRVVPALPERLAGLREIAYNLLWSWDDDLRTVFSRADRELWDLPIHSGGLGVLSGHHLKSAERPRGAARRRGAPLPARLLPPVPELRRLAAGELPGQRLLQRPGPARDRRPGAAGARRGRPRRAGCFAAGLARASGPGAALPPRHERPREPSGHPGRHRPALRRRPGEPHPPGGRAGSGRPARPARARPRPRGVPHERGPLGVRRARARARPDEGQGLHHPHPGPRGLRRLPSRARGQVLRGIPPRGRPHPPRPPRAGATPGRRRRRRLPTWPLSLCAPRASRTG